MSGLVKRVKRVGVGRKPTGIYPELSRVELAKETRYYGAQVGQMLLGKRELDVGVLSQIQELTGIDYRQQGRDWAAMRAKWLEHRRQNYRLKTKTEKRTQEQNT